ncbi:MAG: dienelactone hydrolase family protein [Candidatus Paracaedibacteraceae bacterium]|nr:dienelactone hydrolase family protein [Candidatus Paracaedibacteraceae bacterium]
MLTGPIFAPLSGAIRKIVVFLHGYGSNGANLIDIAEIWSKQLPDTLFIAPNAPYPCDISALGYQWFGLPDLNPFNVRQGLDSIAPTIRSYITKLATDHKLTPKDIALVGFSQGAILSFEMLFQIPGLGGIIDYSGAFYAPTSTEPPKDAPPVLLVHGTADTVVPYAAMLHAQAQLSLYDVTVETHTCAGMGHSIDDAGLRVGINYLKKVLFQKAS